MAYMIHITRNPGMDAGGAAITLDEWVAAVARVDGVRLADGDYSVRLPETGQVFVLRNTGGDTELLFPQAGWRRVFRWDEERVTFVATQDFDDGACHLRSVARQLAGHLEAVVCGEDGKVFP